MTPTPNAAELGRLLRELGPQVLAVLARRHSDFSTAEDAVQEALLAAAARWPHEGLPHQPRAWLYQVARRRWVDQTRGEVARRRREDAGTDALLASELAVAAADDDDLAPERDEALVLLFMCCHPALSAASAIALTLRAVSGLSTAEIARAFLVPEATMAQRISRAKQSIAASSAPRFELPDADERGQRLRLVLHVLYLTFSEGYASSAGLVLERTDLSSEAIRLTRSLQRALPEDPEVGGLLALMLLTDARRAARTGPQGELIPLDEQDRTRWDRGLITEGVALVSKALSTGSIGAYQLQAAIAALHDEAPNAAATDWPQILILYGLLQRMSDSPVVALNHAVAVAMVRGPRVGLELLVPLDQDPRIAGHHRLDAVRAHLWQMAGDPERAIQHYRAAAERTPSLPERDYLTLKAAQLAAEREASGANASGG